MQILSIDWSSGLGTLECTGRVDLTLNGSFADMVVLSSHGGNKSKGTFVLTNPGQLHFYDNACFASLFSKKNKQQNFVSSMQYPMLIPTVEPYMTVGMLGLVNIDGKFSKALSRVSYTCTMDYDIFNLFPITSLELVWHGPEAKFLGKE